MTWWEYWEHPTADPRGFDMPTLNDLGREGWELVAIYERREPGVPLAQRAVFVAIFKRQVTQ